MIGVRRAKSVSARWRASRCTISPTRSQAEVISPPMKMRSGLNAVITLAIPIPR
jgi:hypothetical protein